MFDRWELHRAVIGEVTETGELRALWHDEVVGTIPARFLTDDCPRVRARARAAPAGARGRAVRGAAARRGAARPARLRRPALARVRTRRYDHLVESRTVRRPGPRRGRAAAAPSFRGLALTLDGTGSARRARPVHRRARRRSSRPRATSPARAASRSASPTASTSATPRSPRSAGSWPQSIEGMAQACEALGLPVVSGNVSLYNDTDGRSIHPTPVVGCVGLVSDVRRVPGRLERGRRDRGGVGRLAGPRRLRAAGAPRHRLRHAARARSRRPRPRSSAASPRSRRAARWRTTSPTAASRSRSPRPRSTRAAAPGSTSRSTR